MDFEEDTALFDTVLYHVETFGQNHPDFSFVAELFDILLQKKTSLDEQLAAAEQRTGKVQLEDVVDLSAQHKQNSEATRKVMDFIMDNER